MERNWDIIRAVLLDEENSTEETGKELEKYSVQDIRYNARLLIEEGYLKGHINRNHVAKVIGICTLELTWSEHDLLDSMRGEKTWYKIKNYAKEKGVGLTFDTISHIFLKVVDLMI